MKMNSMKKMLSVIGMFVLIAAMALNFTGCGSNTTPETTAAQAESAEVSFTFVVTDLEGKDTSFEITTGKATVGEALLEEGLIAGEDSQYGLYVTSVNGITADWDKDQTYWAFYINGEYATTGVDSTDVVAGTTYSFVLTGPAPETTSDANVLGEGATVFQFTVVDLEGNETAYEIHTDETTVGAALLAVELVSGDVGEYGLYVTSVNGITADWDADQTYWAFYIDGDYAMTGVDSTEIDPAAAYSFVLTKG